MILSILYECVLLLLAFAMFPRMLYQRWRYGKPLNAFLQKWGRSFPHINKGNRTLVWIHAVSVGETKAVAALAKMLKESMDNPILIISSVTATGHAEAKRNIAIADYYLFLPFDLRFVIKPIVDRVKPDIVVLSETDFWYNFLRFSKQNGAFIALVNGKISERSMRRLITFSLFSKALFSCIDIFCIQNEIYQKRFEQIGVNRKKCFITGNTKLDEEAAFLSAQELSSLRAHFAISADDLVVVVGSTHHPEEKLILDLLPQIWEQFPNVKVLIVPRHPERFDEVAALITEKKYPFGRFTSKDSLSGTEKVILVDAMGILRKCYQLATLAIVGGSFTERVGGHNIVEPTFYGVPVFFGPYMHTQQELVDLVKHYHAGRQVDIAGLIPAVLACLSDEKVLKELSLGGRQLSCEVKGASNRTLQHLLRH